MFDPLPMILERALSEIYSDKGWFEFSIGGEDENLEPPMMQDLYAKALEIAQILSYRGEAAGNIRGALEQRLGSLTRGVKGRCFNTRKSIPFGILLNKPVILELDALNDDEKALLMMFILSLVRANAKTHQRERKENYRTSFWLKKRIMSSGAAKSDGRQPRQSAGNLDSLFYENAGGNAGVGRRHRDRRPTADSGCRRSRQKYEDQNYAQDRFRR